MEKTCFKRNEAAKSKCLRLTGFVKSDESNFSHTVMCSCDSQSQEILAANQSLIRFALISMEPKHAQLSTTNQPTH